MKELNEVSTGIIPQDLYFANHLQEDLLTIMGYIGSLYHGREIGQEIKDKIKVIGYSENLGFASWLKKRIEHYREEGKKIGMGIPLKREKELEEKECMKAFIDSVNKKSEDWNIVKPKEDTVVDVEAKSKITGEKIMAQVRVLHTKEAGEMGARRWTSGIHTAESVAQLIIDAIEDKAKYSVDSTREVYLLLNSIFDIPDMFVNKIKTNLDKLTFGHWKEIYIVFPGYKKNIKIK